MANNKPKVAQVTMISDKDPYCIVQILWYSPDGTSEIADQYYRINLDPNGETAANYPSHGVLVGGQIEDQPEANYYLQTFTSELTTGENPLSLPPNVNLNSQQTIVYFSDSRDGNPIPADGGKIIPSTTDSEGGLVEFVYINAAPRA